METFWQDIQYGLRLVRRNPGFTAVAVLTLALGIGANAAIFSLVDRILLRALPYSRSEQLISISVPPDFHFPSPKTQVWIPLHNDPRNLEAYWAGDFMPVIGWLRPGSALCPHGGRYRLQCGLDHSVSVCLACLLSPGAARQPGRSHGGVALSVEGQD
jgi:hypothetical protein